MIQRLGLHLIQNPGRYICAVFVVWSVILSPLPSSASIVEDVKVTEIDVAGMKNREADGSKYPFCVFFSSAQKDFKEAEKFFSQFVQFFDEETHWQFRKLTVKVNESASKHIPSQIPAIQCFSVWLENDVYTGPWKLKPVKAWAQKLLEGYKSRIPFVLEDLDSSQISNGSLVLLIFMENPVSKDVQRKLQQLRDDFSSVRFFRSSYLNGQKSNSPIAKKFSIETSPAAVLLNFTDVEKVLGKVENDFKFLDRIEEMLIIQKTESVSAISQDTFNRWLQDNDTSSMHLICFHAVWANQNLAYLHVFSRASEVFHNLQTTLKFGTVDVENERDVLMNHVDPKLVKKFPFSVLFWKNVTSEGSDLHQIPLITKPTPSAIYDLLEKSGLEMYDKNGNIVEYIPWETQDICQTFLDYSMCDPVCIGRVNDSHVAARDHEESRGRFPEIIETAAPGESNTTSDTRLYHQGTIDENGKVKQEDIQTTIKNIFP